MRIRPGFQAGICGGAIFLSWILQAGNLAAAEYSASFATEATPAATSKDQQKNDFYNRYFRKGKDKKDDIPVSQEEQKRLLQQVLPKFTPPPEEDKTVLEIDRLIHELGAEAHRRASAIERLSTIGKSALPQLRKALKDNYALRRIGALSVLSYLRDQATIPDIQLLLGDSEATVRAEAVKALGRLKHRGSVELVSACLEDADARVRVESVVALGRIKGLIAKNLLIKAMNNRFVNVRIQVAEELSSFKDGEVVEVLVKSTSDDNREVVIAAVRSLGDIGDAAARPCLKALLHNGDRMIQQEVLQALNNLED